MPIVVSLAAVSVEKGNNKFLYQIVVHVVFRQPTQLAGAMDATVALDKALITTARH